MPNSSNESFLANASLLPTLGTPRYPIRCPNLRGIRLRIANWAGLSPPAASSTSPTSIATAACPSPSSRTRCSAPHPHHYTHCRSESTAPAPRDRPPAEPAVGRRAPASWRACFGACMRVCSRACACGRSGAVGRVHSRGPLRQRLPPPRACRRCRSAVWPGCAPWPRAGPT